jgi:cell fate (sporulation/competence/biofilm development) regulator YlbF (YheA/YmcA/DUF963 family)
LAQTTAPSEAQAKPEMWVGLPKEGKRSPPLRPLRGRFTQLDADRDGRLSAAELERSFQLWRERFKQADRNGDGHLDAEEWRAHKKTQKTVRNSEKPRKRTKKSAIEPINGL